MIEKLVQALRDGGADLDWRQLADTLWLAQITAASSSTDEPVLDSNSAVAAAPSAEVSRRIPAELPTPPSKAELTRVSQPALRRRASAELSGVALVARVPANTALPNRLAIGRALRPFSRRRRSQISTQLDVEATVDRYCNTLLLEPILAPMDESWFREVTLVVDGGPTMVVWRATVDALADLLGHHGAFARVTRWTLTGNRHAVSLQSRAGITVDVRGVIDRDGRQLVLVFTDCVDQKWHGPAAWVALRDWGEYAPVALVQTLPPRLWSATALGDADAAVASRGRGKPNGQLQLRQPWWWTEVGTPREALPVITLEPGQIDNWARMVMAEQGVEVPAVLPGPPTTSEDDSPAPLADVRARVASYRATVSPDAARLSTLLSAVEVTLPVAHLLLEKMIPGGHLAQLAEVLASGLLEPVQPVADQPEAERYEFAPGVREILQEALTTTTTLEVWRTVAPYLEVATGHQTPFASLMAAGSTPAMSSLETRLGRIATELAARLGLNGVAAPDAEPALRVASETARHDGPQPTAVEIERAYPVGPPSTVAFAADVHEPPPQSPTCRFHVLRFQSGIREIQPNGPHFDYRRIVSLLRPEARPVSVGIDPLTLDADALLDAPQELGRSVRSALKELATSVDVLILDLSHIQPLLRDVGLLSLAEEVRRETTERRKPTSTLLVLFAGLPPSPSLWYRPLAPLIEAGRVGLVDSMGRSTLDRVRDTHGIFIWPQKALSGAIRAKVIVRRGWYLSQNNERIYLRHLFDGKYASEEIARLLVDYLTDVVTGEDPWLVLWHPGLVDWLQEPLMVACAVLNLASMAYPPSADEGVLAEFNGRGVVLALPVVDTGSTALSMMENVHSALRPRSLEVISVLSTSGQDESHGIRRLTDDKGVSQAIRYFQRVDQVRVSVDDSRCDPRVIGIRPSQPGDAQAEMSSYEFWDLVGDTGLVFEDDVPAGRAGIQAVPDTSAIVRRYGPWVAERLYNLLSRQMGARPSDLVLVCPADAEAEELARCVLTVAGGTVIAVPRAVIERVAQTGAADAFFDHGPWSERFDRLTTRDVVLIDSFVITGLTRQALAMLVADRGLNVRAMCSLFDRGAGSAGYDTYSLYGWGNSRSLSAWPTTLRRPTANDVTVLRKIVEREQHSDLAALIGEDLAWSARMVEQHQTILHETEPSLTEVPARHLPMPTTNIDSPRDLVDIAVLTILPVEHQAVRFVFGMGDEDFVIGEHDEMIYRTSVRSERLSRNLSVIEAFVGAASNTEITRVVRNLLARYNPDLTVLVGIGAGRPDKFSLGDVAIPRAVRFYETTRPEAAGGRSQPLQVDMARPLTVNLDGFDPVMTHFYDDLSEYCRGMPSERLPEALDLNKFRPAVRSRGVVTATRALIIDSEYMEGLAKEEQISIVGDQDSYAFAHALMDNRWAVFRGISDLGESSKRKDWQHLAATCAAVCLKSFLQSEYVSGDRT
jgi:nucleoside phosphorylase